MWPALQAHDPRAVVDFLVALGFEETSSHLDDTGALAHAQLDWSEGGGVLLGPHRRNGPFTQQPGSSAAYVVTADVEAVMRRAHQAGIAYPDSPTEQDYGSRDVTLRDPEGNQWIFGTYPGEPRASATS